MERRKRTNITDVGSGWDASAFFNYANVAAFGSSNVLVVWHDDAAGGGSNIVYNYSSDGGASWAFSLSGGRQGQVLYSGHYPSLDGIGQAAHLISNQGPSEKMLVYSRWNGSTWTMLQEPIVSNTFWKGWPDIAGDADGELHTVWDEPYGPESWQHYIAYSTTANQEVPPAAPSSFTAAAGHNQVPLSWTNPYDPDFERTIIRVSTTGFPGSPEDGLLVADVPASPGSDSHCVHSGVVNGAAYYYTAFARDAGGLYSSPAHASARPFVPPDLDRDGDVDLCDFGVLQRCLSGPFVPSPDAACQAAMMDADGDVDQDDVIVFEGCLGGSSLAYEPTCAD